jgi:hypothetical protein
MKNTLKPTEETLVTFNFTQPLTEDVKMTVWAVDDAVLKLAQFILENPLDYFASKQAAYEALTAIQGKKKREISLTHNNFDLVPFTPPSVYAWTARKFFYVVTLTGKGKKMFLLKLILFSCPCPSGKEHHSTEFARTYSECSRHSFQSRPVHLLRQTTRG